MELTSKQLKEEFKPYKIKEHLLYTPNTERQLIKIISELDKLSNTIYFDEWNHIRLEEAQLELISRN